MIVQATGIAVFSGNPERKKRVEDAMKAACEQAAADGITDPDRVRELMLRARDEVTHG